MQVTGVDVSHTMITSARKMLWDQQLSNVEYRRIPHLAGPYPFHEASFDLISGQLVNTFLMVDEWPCFLSACWNLLRPGGLLRLTVGDVGQSNAPAHEELNRLFLHMMRLTGRSFSSSDRSLGLLDTIESLLYLVGFRECFTVVHEVDYSYGAPLHKEWKRNLLLIATEIQPLLVEMGLAAQEQVDVLHHQQCYEMHIPTFQATLPLLTLWGTKPRTR